MDHRIDRSQLQAVIRRAAELYAAESDSRDLLSETEVIRIGEELGLPTRLVRQALYELPDAAAPESGWLGRVFGPALTGGSRAVTGEPGVLFARLEEYLATREYLQPRRRQGETVLLEPAGDAISNMARAIWRPAGRFHLARASRVFLTVRPLESGIAHVRLTLDLADRRRRAAVAGLVGGAFLGLGVGAGLVILTLATLGPVAPAAPLLAAGLGLAGFAGTVAAITAAAARRFRRVVDHARSEVAGLLDRMEHGERLEPPPAPWWRRMQRGRRRGA